MSDTRREALATLPEADARSRAAPVIIDVDTPAPVHDVTGAAVPGTTGVIPLVEETISVAKRIVETGRVRVRSYVETSPETVRETLSSETVEVKRVAVDRLVDEVPRVRSEDGVTIVPVFEEVLVIEKRVLLKEEIHLVHRVVNEEHTAEVMLRRQRVDVEREPSA